MPSYVAGRPRTGRILSDEEIIRRYADGMDSFTLGLQAGCSAVTVIAIVRAAGGAVRTPGSSQRRVLRISDEEIIQLYQAGLSGTVIADRAGCTAGTIYKLLKANGVPCRRGYDKSKTTRQAAHRARQSEKGKLSAEAGRRRKAATGAAAGEALGNAERIGRHPVCLNPGESQGAGAEGSGRRLMRESLFNSGCQLPPLRE